MQVTGDNFLLTYTKDGIAYPVMLSDEQKEVFNITMSLIPGTIQIIMSL